MVTVFNKTDCPGAPAILRDPQSDFQVRISALTGEGIGKLEEILSAILRSRRIYLERLFPYREAGRIQQIRREGELLGEEYREDGIFVTAYVPAEIYESLIRPLPER